MSQQAESAMSGILCMVVGGYVLATQNCWVAIGSNKLLWMFDIRVTVHRDKFLIIKPTRCTNFSNLFWNETTYFGQFLCPSLGVFHCTHNNGTCHTCLLTACERDQDGTAVPSWCRSQAVSKHVWRIPLLCVQWKTPDDVQRNCPKYVDFHSKINVRN